MSYPNQSPIADFSGPTQGYVNQRLLYNSGEFCEDTDCRIVKFSWNFGDGTKHSE